jgi:2-hydroxychromene-2-carboxylate isomerase
MAILEFFYDFASPYSYLASTRVEALAQRTGAEIRFRPFFLAGVFKATGNRSPVEVMAKAKYLLDDLGRWARRYDIPFRFPSVFPVTSLLALRSALILEKQGKLIPFTHAVYRAVFAEDQDIGDAEIVKRLVTGVGADGPAVVAAAPGEKESLVKQTQEAVERGAFGAPALFVREQLFVGNDRLDFVEEALRSPRTS